MKKIKRMTILLIILLSTFILNSCIIAEEKEKIYITNKKYENDYNNFGFKDFTAKLNNQTYNQIEQINMVNILKNKYYPENIKLDYFSEQYINAFESKYISRKYTSEYYNYEYIDTKILNIEYMNGKTKIISDNVLNIRIYNNYFSVSLNKNYNYYGKKVYLIAIDEYGKFDENYKVIELEKLYNINMNYYFTDCNWSNSIYEIYYIIL
ncbi:hypothetical protein OF820_02085 [Oceanotoga sp. DSM 15011]|uniref:hypothetical protein n=1 Tax=Oceanotoga TaxID=1255275 RepID=UPI0021F482BA|nr:MULTISPECIES: hypothetical protein [Oceanotoga]MDO7977300.1 hypothetical protein [Oceanotoga teriensis]UYP00481.1 hypothetical protein OF820_02085 [Oceanotoga sp. DSM 15011]